VRESYEGAQQVRGRLDSVEEAIIGVLQQVVEQPSFGPTFVPTQRVSGAVFHPELDQRLQQRRLPSAECRTSD
jgi:hypothetical protein